MPNYFVVFSNCGITLRVLLLTLSLNCTHFQSLTKKGRELELNDHVGRLDGGLYPGSTIMAVTEALFVSIANMCQYHFGVPFFRPYSSLVLFLTLTFSQCSVRFMWLIFVYLSFSFFSMVSFFDLLAFTFFPTVMVHAYLKALENML